MPAAYRQPSLLINAAEGPTNYWGKEPISLVVDTTFSSAKLDNDTVANARGINSFFIKFLLLNKVEHILQIQLSMICQCRFYRQLQ